MESNYSLKNFSERYFKRGKYKDMSQLEHMVHYTGIDKNSFNINLNSKKE